MSQNHRPDRRETLASGLALAALAGAPAKAASSKSFKMFDGHLHLISDDLARYPMATGPSSPGADPPGTPRPGDSISAGKVHILPTTEQGIKWMDDAGVETAAAVQRRGSYGFDNSYILDASDAHPARFHAVVVLDAEDPATPGQLASMVRSHKIAGLRITGGREKDGSFPWLDSEAALKTWAAAERLGLTMNVLYAPQRFSAEALAAILRVARKFSRTTIVIDHLGWPEVAGAPGYGFANFPPGLIRQRNVHFKFSTSNLNIVEEGKIPTQDFMRYTVRLLGAHRILWGSDVGSGGGEYAETVQRARHATATLTPAEQRQVLRETGFSVFKRGGKLS